MRAKNLVSKCWLLYKSFIICYAYIAVYMHAYQYGFVNDLIYLSSLAVARSAVIVYRLY